MRAKKNKPWSKFFLALLAIILLGFAAYAALSLVPPVDTNEFVETDVIRVEGSSVVIGRNCTAIIAETSPERLESIRLGLEGRIDIRPTTHENFLSVLDAFNITLERVVIYRFENDIFYSDSYFTRDDKVLQLDMRPSDAIALAVRTKSPVYINRTLLAEMGSEIC